MINFELGFVLRRAGSDCSNNGPTSKYDFCMCLEKACPKNKSANG